MRGGKLDHGGSGYVRRRVSFCCWKASWGSVPPLHILKIMHFHTYPTLYLIHEQNCTEFPGEESSKLVMGHAW